MQFKHTAKKPKTRRSKMHFLAQTKIKKQKSVKISAGQKKTQR